MREDIEQNSKIRTWEPLCEGTVNGIESERYISNRYIEDQRAGFKVVETML